MSENKHMSSIPRIPRIPQMSEEKRAKLAARFRELRVSDKNPVAHPSLYTIDECTMGESVIPTKKQLKKLCKNVPR